MRSNRYPWPREAALGLLEAAEAAHLAFVDDDGRPVLRCVHTVLDEGALCFHGSRAGEKALGVGRPATAAVERTLAVLPSYAKDPERACPATTWYESVQVHGVLGRVEDPERKARVLAKLLARLQPEGGYVPLAADHPLYEAALRGIDVLALPLEEVTGRAKVGQNRSPEEVRRALEVLWERGLPGADRQVAAILRARPDVGPPTFLQGPGGAVLTPRPDDDLVHQAVDLVADAYWNVATPRPILERAHRMSPVWVGAHDGEGRLVASARATTDGAKHAWIYDVAVAAPWRGQGLGEALCCLLLDHPAVRDVLQVHLQTRDAEGFYARLGFAPYPPANPRYVLLRDGGGGAPRGEAGGRHAVTDGDQRGASDRGRPPRSTT